MLACDHGNGNEVHQIRPSAAEEVQPELVMDLQSMENGLISSKECVKGVYIKWLFVGMNYSDIYEMKNNIYTFQEAADVEHVHIQ